MACEGSRWKIVTPGTRNNSDQPSADIIKWPLFKSPEKYSQDLINPIPERRLYLMWTQHKRHEGLINATWWKTRNLSLQRTMVHKEKCIQRTAPSEESQKWITSQGLQQKHWYIQHIYSSGYNWPPWTKIELSLIWRPIWQYQPYKNSHEYSHLIDTPKNRRWWGWKKSIILKTQIKT